MSVGVAANGFEAIQALESIPYDLVLMDVQMPELDGLSATRRIRESHSRVLNPRVPIIALTAHAMQGDEAQCLAAGMDGYVVKPIEVSSLIAAVEKWLKVEGPDQASLPVPVVKPPVAATVKRKLPIFDRASLLHRVLDDEELAQAVIVGFLGDLPKQIQQLKALAAAGASREFGDQAHKIKGACAAVGGEVLRELAAVLEQAGKAGDLTTITARVSEVDAQFAALKEAMTNEV